MARHVPTPEQRTNVTVLTGLGASPEMLAGLLNIEVATLQVAYAKELKQGPETVKLEAMKQLFNASKTAEGAGRVTAAVKLLDMLQGDDQASMDAKTIRINGDMRAAYFGACDPPKEPMFFRDGSQAEWVYTTGADDGV
jgi:hypothetical protein